MIREIERRYAAINVKVLLILGLVVVLLGGGLFAGHRIRKRMIAEKALSAGLDAYEHRQWSAASRELRRYLEKFPKDNDILEKYAESVSQDTPLSAYRAGIAIANFRELLRRDPNRDTVYRRLARLYRWTGNYVELIYIAQRRLEIKSCDLEAVIWEGQGHLGKGEFDEIQEVLAPFVQGLESTTEKHPEYVEACGLLAESFLQKSKRGDQDFQAEALGWLTRACQYDPTSAEAFVNRARFHLMQVGGPHGEEAQRLARADVSTASKGKIEDPRIALKVSQVWMGLGELDHGEAALKAVRELKRQEIKDYYLDPLDWYTARFVQAAELVVRREAKAEAGPLADEWMKRLTDKRIRTIVLPPAIQLYVVAGRIEDARKHLSEYDELLRVRNELGEDSDRMAVLQGLVAHGEKNDYEVIARLEPLAARDSADMNVWALLSEAYSRTGQGRRSAEALQRYLKYRPGDRGMAMQMVRELIKEGQWTKALAAARAAEGRDPENFSLKLMRIEASLLSRSNFGEESGAARLARLGNELAALQEDHPKSAQVRVLQSMLAEQSGEGEAALKVLREAIETSDDPLVAELRLAKLLFVSGHLAKASEIAEKAVEHHSGSIEAWRALVDIQEGRGQYKEALLALKQGASAVEDPEGQKELAYRGALLNVLHLDRPAGVNQLRKMASEDPTSIRARRLLLDMKEVRSDRAEADRLVKEIREVEGESGLIWRLAQAVLWMGEAGWRDRQLEIRETLERCIEGDPQWPAPVLMLGQLYERLANPGQAESVYRQGLQANPASIQVADRLSKLLQGQERFSEAKLLLNEIDADPSRLNAQRVQTALNAGNVSEAIEVLQLRVNDNPDDVNSLVLLAQLMYHSTRDASAALKQLDEAESKAPPSMSTLAARVAIFKAEKRFDEAKALLDEAVDREKSFEMYYLRGMYRGSVEDLSGAEEDFRHLISFQRAGQGYDLLGRFFLETGRSDEAISSWEKGLDTFPDNQAIMRNLMKGLLARGGDDDRSRATSLLTKLEAEHPADADLMWTRARILLAEGSGASKQKAGDLLQHVVEIQPKAVDAYMALIRLAVEQENYAEVRDLALRGLGANQNHPGLTLVRAEAEMALKNESMARELVRLVLEENPDQVEGLDLFARMASSSGDEAMVAEAMNRLDDALSRLPERSEPLQLARARLLLGTGRAEAAATGLEGYVSSASGSQSIPAYLGLIELLQGRNEYGKAREWLEKAAKLQPEHPGVIRARIVLLGQDKKFDEIIKIASSYGETQSADPKVMLTAAATLASAGTEELRKKSLDISESVLQDWPGRVDAQLAVATVSLQRGDFDRAETMYRRILEASPRNGTVLNNLANILSEVRGEQMEALRLVERGVEAEPENIHLLDTYGMILLNMPTRLGDARAALEKCVSLAPGGHPTRAKAELRLALVHAKQGDLAKAGTLMEEANRAGEQLGVFGEKQKAIIEEIKRLISSGK